MLLFAALLSLALFVLRFFPVVLDAVRLVPLVLCCSVGALVASTVGLAGGGMVIGGEMVYAG